MIELQFYLFIYLKKQNAEHSKRSEQKARAIREIEVCYHTTK